MKPLLIVTIAVALVVPAAAVAGPPSETGLGGYTAYLAGGNNPKVGWVTTGNGKEMRVGVGQWTASDAQQTKTETAPN